MQVLHTSVKLKEQLLELPYSNFMDSMKGYTPVKNTKKLVKYFEKMQNQLNISEDKVGIASCKLFTKDPVIFVEFSPSLLSSGL